ncbi:MAG: sodium:solute symporter family protein [Candidatus Zipacnadales bacterium]
MHPLDFAVVIAYLVGIAGLGIFQTVKIRSSGDYFAGGRKFSKFMMAMHALGTGTHADDPVGVTGTALQRGMSGIWWTFCYLFATPVYWIVAPLFRRSRYLTTADFFEERYSRGLAVLYTIVGLLTFSVSTGMMLRATAVIADGVTGGAVPDWVAIGGMTLVFVAYSFFGGLMATIVTESIQGVLIVVMSLLLVPFGLRRIGGFRALHELIPAGQFSLHAPEETTLGFVGIMSLVAIIGIVAQPHIMEVCSAGKTEYEGRVGFTYGNFVKRFCAMGWTLTGLIVLALAVSGRLPVQDTARMSAAFPAGVTLSGEVKELVAQMPEVAQKTDAAQRQGRELAFPTAIRVLLPPGFTGLMFAAILAAQMSTLSALMVAGSALFTRNIYKRYLRPAASDQQVLKVGRFAGLLIVVLGILFAVAAKSVIEGLSVFLLLPTLTGLLMWVGVAWRRTTTAGAWLSFLVMAPVFLLLGKGGSLLAPYFPGAGWLGMYSAPKYSHLLAMSYLIPGFVALIFGSLLTRPKPAEVLDRFYTLINTPVGQEEKLTQAGIEPIYIGNTEPHPWETNYPRLVHWGGFVIALLFALAILGMVWLLGWIGS